MATFNETGAPAFRKYVSEQGIVTPNLSEKFRIFWSHSSISVFRKKTLKSKFSEIVLPLRHPLVITFNEMRAPASYPRYTNAKFSRETSISLVALLPFRFRKTI